MSKNHPDREKREKYFIDKYDNKFKFAGSKHNSVKFVLSIINNTRSNPKNLFVAEGLWAMEKVKYYKTYIESFFFCPELIFTPEAERMVDYGINSADKSYSVSEKVFQKMGERESPDGLLAVCRLPEFKLDDIPLSRNVLLIILDGIEIPGNIGTIIRSSDGAGADGILICNRRARLTHPKVIRGSHGSVLKKPVIESELDEIRQWLKKNGFKIFLTDTDAKKGYYQADYSGRVAIVAGSERYGLSKEWYDDDACLISIPMYGDADSLNVAISTTIVMYQASLYQRGKIT
jgi:TrmH family RNA methyltransferase